MPSLVILAGSNGAGKSTLYRHLSERFPVFGAIPFINPDEIAKGYFGSYLQEDSSKNRRLMLRAGKEALRQRELFIRKRVDFGFETTLSGNSEIRLIENAKRLGYRTTMVFIGLDHPALHVMRVKLRVQNGGHHVDPIDIVRRQKRCIENLKRIQPMVDRLYIVDNSGDGHRLVGLVLQRSSKRSVTMKTIDGIDWYVPILNFFKDVDKC